ncbi:CapA family protein [Virgibacillus siamensis]|uniref:CapA family protein n=1 Tax=Virgibacillus siamensis TaxID=480071 RepID=UPI0009869A44|nr:CapA family protein [Virgibacillus siamensis]
MRWGKLTGLFVILFLSIVLAACANDAPDQTSKPTENNGTDEGQETEEPAEPEKPETIHKKISITAIGDMLIHDRVYEDAKTKNGYDFRPMLNRVKPYLKNSTITMANQETMIGGIELGLSSYPSFNSPYAVGDALKDAGVDVVTLANNHTLDRGEAAIQSAIKHWESIDMMYTGAFKNEADSNRIRVYETDEGISTAFLAYTYGTNGIPVPTDKDYLVNLIDRGLMESEIQKAKKQADIVVLSMHFGDQYIRMPNDEQKALVQFAADQGVDVVIGHHPHVLQPVDWVKGKHGNKTLVAYSLGNFLSGQDEFYRKIGGIFKFTVHKTIKGNQETVKIDSPKFMPTFVEYENWSDFEVTPMFQLTNDELANAQQHYKEIKQHVSQWMPGLEFIEK